MTFSQTSTKAAFLRNKVFLKKLYEGEEPFNKEVILNASLLELNTLIKFLHFLASGQIPFKKEHFQIILSKKKLKSLRKAVETKKATQQLLKEERGKKIQFLSSFNKLYSTLLYPLFNEQ